MARRPKEAQTKTEGGNFLFLNKSGESEKVAVGEKKLNWGWGGGETKTDRRGIRNDINTTTPKTPPEKSDENVREE